MLLTYYNGIENVPAVVLDAYSGENTFITDGISAVIQGPCLLNIY